MEERTKELPAMTTPTDKELRARIEANLQTMAMHGTGLSQFAWNEFSNDVLGLLDRIAGLDSELKKLKPENCIHCGQENNTDGVLCTGCSGPIHTLQEELSATRSQLEEAQKRAREFEDLCKISTSKDTRRRAAALGGTDGTT